MTGPDVKADAARVLDVIADGGVAIVQLDVAYAILGHSDESIRRIFTAKQRSFEKPSGMFSNWTLFNEIHEVDARARDVVRTIIQEHDLPFSVVAPFKADHPIIRSLPAFALANSTKAGTLDMLLNAGPLHNEMTRQAHERGIAIVGSSANASLTGSKFTVDAIDAPVRAAADIVVDYGLCKYHNEHGRSSSIIDLRTYETIRVGVCYDRIREILRETFDLDLAAIGRG